jgi:TPP-dependent 2-oxoacid decarboxylase
MSNTRIRQPKAALLAQMQAVIAGLQKHFPNVQFTFGNTAYTTLVTLFQSVITALTQLNAAQASAKDAVTALTGVTATMKPVFLSLKRNLQNTYGTTSTTLADFGLQPQKARTPMTVEQKAAAKAKAEATRKARGTTSKKQKLAVTGNVVGVTVTPITASSSSEPSVQPATVPANAPPTGTSAK